MLRRKTHYKQPRHITAAKTPKCKINKLIHQTRTQTFASPAPDRSSLQKLPNTPKTVSHLQTMQELKERQTQQELLQKVKEEEDRFERKKKMQTSTIRGNKRVGDMLSNDLTQKQLKEINEAASISTPPPHLTRSNHSPYFIPLWDPELSQNIELRKGFENSSGLKYESMNLVGNTLLGQPVELRNRLIQKNKVSLVQLVSTSEPLNYANTTAEVWMEALHNHGESNQDGAIIVEPTVINVSEGFLYGLFLNQTNKKMIGNFGDHVKDNVISFHIKSDNDAISRARRFLDCRNRFVSNLFLVDEEGLIRWRSALATTPTAEFMDNLISVTNDLILETKFGDEEEM